MEADHVYQYSRLTGKDAIRLIHLQPSGHLESGIVCSLKDATLAEYRDGIADHYVAISYVWGDENDRRSISVDGKPLDITASLECALRHIRDRACSVSGLTAFASTKRMFMIATSKYV